jgi:hypothetical protein
MRSSEIASKFAEYIGEERWSKFHRLLYTACPKAGRLMRWQQALWEEFARIHALDAELPYTEIRALLGGCPVHHSPLLSGLVPIIYGRPEEGPPGFHAARVDDFPMSNFVYRAGCLVTGNDPTATTILYCERCRDEHLAWDRKHGAQTERLQGLFSYATWEK